MTAYRYGETIRISGEGLRFASSMLGDKAPPTSASALAPSRITRSEGITQPPEVERARSWLPTPDRRRAAPAGGFDFNRNKFNHATQAWRQPGSSFKPFIYGSLREGAMARIAW